MGSDLQRWQVAVATKTRGGGIRFMKVAGLTFAKTKGGGPGLLENASCPISSIWVL